MDRNKRLKHLYRNLDQSFCCIQVCHKGKVTTTSYDIYCGPRLPNPPCQLSLWEESGLPGRVAMTTTNEDCNSMPCSQINQNDSPINLHAIPSQLFHIVLSLQLIKRKIPVRLKSFGKWRTFRYTKYPTRSCTESQRSIKFFDSCVTLNLTKN